jgi:GTP-binding protein
MSLPTVAIVGRPNVGKSSLFNRFLKKNLAVVSEQPGVTRDRNYSVCDWNGREFRLVDTGGIVTETDDLMDRLIFDQTEFALHEADLVLLLVACHVGLDTTDREIARTLLKAKTETILVVNKVDNDSLTSDAAQFYKLGLGEPSEVSATVGLGIGDLLDRLVDALPPESEFEDDPDAIRVALVGRPNVGKSSFINKLIGSDRLIVSPIAGTTRDAVDTPFEIDGKRYVMVDTAGLRRKYKVHENVEFYTNLRTERAIDSCDVALVLIDAEDGMTTQDQRVLEQVIGRRRSAVLVVNKWDLIEKETHTAEKFKREINETLAKYAYLPIIFISAMTGQRVAKTMQLVDQVYEQTHRKITTSELNDFLQMAIGKKHPPAKMGKYIKFNYVTQTEVSPPTFVFFCNRPEMVDKTYLAYLGNQLRSTFGFEGVPFRIKCRKK